MMENEIKEYAALLKKTILDFVYENDFLEDTFLRINMLDIDDVKAVFLEQTLIKTPEDECYYDVSVLDLVITDEVSYDQLDLDDSKIEQLAKNLIAQEI